MPDAGGTLIKRRLCVQERCSGAEAAVAARVSRLQRHAALERDTAGNVRLESDARSAPWRATAADAVQASFSGTPGGWHALEVQHVVRMHNRLLALAWEDGAGGEADEERLFQYALWAPASNGADEVDAVIEHGFWQRCAAARCACKLLG
jgi:hypothetical protein